MAFLLHADPMARPVFFAGRLESALDDLKTTAQEMAGEDLQESSKIR